MLAAAVYLWVKIPLGNVPQTAQSHFNGFSKHLCSLSLLNHFNAHLPIIHNILLNCTNSTGIKKFMLTILMKHDDQLHKLWAQLPPPAFHTAQTRIASVTGLKPLSGCSALPVDFKPSSCWILCLQSLPVIPQHCLQGCTHPVGSSKLTAWTSRTRKAPLEKNWFWDNSPARAFLLHGLEADATKLQMYVLQIDPNTNLRDCLSPSCYKIFFLGSDLILTQLCTGVSVSSSNWVVSHISNLRKQCTFI